MAQIITDLSITPGTEGLPGTGATEGAPGSNDLGIRHRAAPVLRVGAIERADRKFPEIEERRVPTTGVLPNAAPEIEPTSTMTIPTTAPAGTVRAARIQDVYEIVPVDFENSISRYTYVIGQGSSNIENLTIRNKSHTHDILVELKVPDFLTTPETLFSISPRTEKNVTFIVNSNIISVLLMENKTNEQTSNITALISAMNNGEPVYVSSWNTSPTVKKPWYNATRREYVDILPNNAIVSPEGGIIFYEFDDVEGLRTSRELLLTRDSMRKQIAEHKRSLVEREQIAENKRSLVEKNKLERPEKINGTNNN